MSSTRAIFGFLAVICCSLNSWAINLSQSVPHDLYVRASDFLDHNRDLFDNQDYMSIVDYRPRSDNYRFFVINLRNGSVQRFHTTHGSGSVGSDIGYAIRFSNVIDSLQSSLGLARTGEVYIGANGRSLKLDGLESSDSNLRVRGIVVHGDDDVHEKNIIQSLSAGCPVLDMAVRDEVINEIRNGSLIYFGYSNSDD